MTGSRYSGDKPRRQSDSRPPGSPRGYDKDEYYRRAHRDSRDHRSYRDRDDSDNRGLRGSASPLGDGSRDDDRHHGRRGRAPLSARTLEGIRGTRWNKLEQAIPSIEDGLDKIKTNLARLESIADELKKAGESYKDDHEKLRQVLSESAGFDLSEITKAYSNRNVGYKNATDYQFLYEDLGRRIERTKQVLKDSVIDNLNIIEENNPLGAEKDKIEDQRKTTQQRLTDTLAELRGRFDAVERTYSYTASIRLFKYLLFPEKDRAMLAEWTEPVFKKREQDICATMKELSKHRDGIIDQAYKDEDREAVQILYEAMRHGIEVFFTAIRDLKACNPSPEAQQYCRGREQKYGTQFRDDVKYLHWYLEVAWPRQGLLAFTWVEPRGM